MVPNCGTEAKVLTYGENIAFMPMIPLQREMDTAVQLEQK